MANFIVEVTDVGEVVSKKKGQTKWYEFTVTYNSDKGEKEKKFLSFNKDEYNLGKTLKEGKKYEIRLEKDGDFWVWVEADETDEPVAAAKVGGGGGNKVPGGFAIKDQERQLNINRQSAVKAAVDFVNGQHPAGNAMVHDILKIADMFVNFYERGLEVEVEEDVDPAPKPKGRPRKNVEEPDVE